MTVYTNGFEPTNHPTMTTNLPANSSSMATAKYAANEVHINTCESHGRRSDPWLSPHREISKDKLTQYLRAFQLCRELFRKLGKEALKHAIRATSKINNVLHKSKREIRSGLYLRDSLIRVVKGVVSVAIRTEREHVDAAHVDVEQTPACCEVDVAAEQAAVTGGNPDDTTNTDAAPRQTHRVIK